VNKLETYTGYERKEIALTYAVSRGLRMSVALAIVDYIEEQGELHTEHFINQLILEVDLATTSNFNLEQVLLHIERSKRMIDGLNE
jgi:hypothetical protein